MQDTLPKLMHTRQKHNLPERAVRCQANIDELVKNPISKLRFISRHCGLP